jgi:hypothetical protein
MKKLIWVVYLTVVFFSAFKLAFGAEVPYTFATVDTFVPGHPEAFAWPVDVNDKGVMVFRLDWKASCAG